MKIREEEYQDIVTWLINRGYENGKLEIDHGLMNVKVTIDLDELRNNKIYVFVLVKQINHSLSFNGDYQRNRHFKVFIEQLERYSCSMSNLISKLENNLSQVERGTDSAREREYIEILKNVSTKHKAGFIDETAP